LENSKLFTKVLHGFRFKLLDSNIWVQEAACLALTTFEEVTIVFALLYIMSCVKNFYSVFSTQLFLYI